MNQFERVQLALRRHPRKWLVTGCAGFIGSNLVEFLLQLDQTVVGLDNLSTGFRHNLDDVRAQVGPARWQRGRWPTRVAALRGSATGGAGPVRRGCGQVTRRPTGAAAHG